MKEPRTASRITVSQKHGGALAVIYAKTPGGREEYAGAYLGDTEDQAVAFATQIAVGRGVAVPRDTPTGPPRRQVKAKRQRES